jgi:Arc/MetJ family transcription regulator
MRTTIEMTDEQRAKLVHLAAQRGLKGFSALVQEALELYLKARDGRSEEVRAALGVRGALKGKEADQLAERCRGIRSNWR